MGLWRQVVPTTMLLLALADSVRADSLADARKAVEGSDYLTAKPAVEQALKAGTASPADLAEIYRLTGVVEGALGDAQKATSAFAKWLSMDPKGSLPAGTSPKITRPFNAAQDQLRKRGALQAKSETADNPPAVTLVIVNDPNKLIVGAKVFFVVDRKPEQTLEAEGSDRITIELERGKRLDLRLHAVDEYGNRVVELGSKDVPIVITSSGEDKQVIDPKDTGLLLKPKEIEEPAPRPLYLQWWLWGTVTVVTTGVAGYFAYQTRSDLQQLDHLNANSLAHPWSDAQAVESSAKRNLLIANITAGAAGAFAIGTILLYITRPRTMESETRAAVTPVPGGGAIVVGGRF